MMIMMGYSDSCGGCVWGEMVTIYIVCCRWRGASNLWQIHFKLYQGIHSCGNGYSGSLIFLPGTDMVSLVSSCDWLLCMSLSFLLQFNASYSLLTMPSTWWLSVMHFSYWIGTWESTRLFMSMVWGWQTEGWSSITGSTLGSFGTSWLYFHLR